MLNSVPIRLYYWAIKINIIYTEYIVTAQKNESGRAAYINHLAITLYVTFILFGLDTLKSGCFGKHTMINSFFFSEINQES